MMLLLSWGIHIGSGGSLLGTLITGDLRLVFCCDGHNIASSSGCSVVVVVLGRGTVEIVGVAEL